ncbi:hypothetical protein [Thiocystis violacea]|uniref:hypothetical protein n=1 Tax=Thiocystis violacea TaxID=13725 RepID=UPI001906A25A|nr:hypothetical protein [Thiocystis violacea]MBK1723409.1 hypothetical protein [Thiocystis violacea]
MTSCSTMRVAVTLSATLLASGILLLLVAETSGLMIPMAHIALLMVLAGAAVLGFAFLFAVLPGGGHRLNNCQH